MGDVIAGLPPSYSLKSVLTHETRQANLITTRSSGYVRGSGVDSAWTTPVAEQARSDSSFFFVKGSVPVLT